MEEVKLRLDHLYPLVRSIKSSEPKDDDFPKAESCYLQVRLICELISLSTLLAHHHQGLDKALLKSWHAGKIFDSLERSNQNAFPKVAEFKVGAVGPSERISIRPDALTKAEFSNIYGKCGDLLHRGMLSHILDRKPRAFDLAEVDTWATRIGRQLASHAVLVKGTGKLFMCSLTGGPNNTVLVGLGNAPPEFFTNVTGAFDLTAKFRR